MKFLNLNSVLLIFLISTLLIACKKEKLSIQYTAINTGVTSTIYKLKQVSADTIYLCGGGDSSGFILRSADGGKSWQNFQNNFWEKILDLDFSGDQLIIAVSQYINFFKSNNKGLTWKLVTPQAGQYPLGAYAANMYSIDMVNDTIGFACGGENFQQGFIYRTNDGGETWLVTNKNHEMRSILMSDIDNGFASGYGVVYRTSDGGVNWNVTAADNEFYTGLCSANNETVFASGFNGGIKQGAFGSDNWSTKIKSNGVGKRIHFNCIDFYNTQIGVAAGTNGVIYITTDGGANWSEGQAFDGALINTVLLLSVNDGLAAGKDGQLFHFSF